MTLNTTHRELGILGLLVVFVGSAFFVTYRTATAKQKQRVLGQDANAIALFVSNCAKCHGKDGRAKTFKAKFNHARNLTEATWQDAISDEHMYESILKGKGKMPAFEKRLSRPEIAGLVTYVRTLKR